MYIIGATLLRARSSVAPRMLGSPGFSTSQVREVCAQGGEVETLWRLSFGPDEVGAHDGVGLVRIGVVEPPGHRLQAAPGHDPQLVGVVADRWDAVPVLRVGS